MSARTRVKICCISNERELALAVDRGADLVGFVGPMPSGPGIIGDDAIGHLQTVVPGNTQPVLLTSETTANGIRAHAQRTRTTTVQIVQTISPQESAQLATRSPDLYRIQVVHVQGNDALDAIDLYGDTADAFLLDSGRPDATRPELGGTGRTHDWDVSAAFVAASPRPVFLAGGLNADNVSDAIRHVRPYGVDVCSGVRRSGKRLLELDPDKLQAFMQSVATVDLEIKPGDF